MNRITQKVIEVTEAVCSQVRKVLEKAKDKAQAQRQHLKEAIERTGRLLDQGQTGGVKEPDHSGPYG